ncbi:MAG: hypothetical protein P4N60_16235 [Verrucomicrobiae bacterium]|nr:hypothetical protein [Verrucomicrobiae bacterium]
MKKICILAVIAATCGLASATTVNVPSGLTGTGALAGENAYAWGIPISLSPGQSISTASLTFTDIKLTAANQSGKGILYSDLLNSSLTGVHTYTDNDAPGDYFTGHYSGGNIVSLGSQIFASVGTTLSWTVTFNSTQLAALNAFLVNGIFDIGFDPDCHYNVGCIAFNYTTTPVSTPDTATTIYLLGLALLALEVSRRKLAMAKK